MYNRGTTYLNKNNYKKALKCFLPMLKTFNFSELLINTGNAYRGLGQYSVAIDYYKRAIDTPDSNGRFGALNNIAFNNLGLMAYLLGDSLTASGWYLKALALDPSYSACIFNLAVARLKMSNCANGWDEYEYRAKNPYFGSTLPLGTSICVICEQGIGDKIMFARYMPMLLARYRDVYVVGHPSLAIFFPGCINVTSEPLGVPAVGLCSLRLLLDCVPPVVGGWVGGSDVGVCWKGSDTHLNDANRSCNPAYFVGFNGVNLNPAVTHPKIPSLAPKTWGDTINFVRHCSHVVTVDTSVAHLCGSLGVPTIMIQPLYDTDFRWGSPGDINVWYPSVVVVHNTSWESSIAIAQDIIKCIKQ